MDDGPDEVAKVGGRADFQGFGHVDEFALEARPEGRRHVGTARSTAFLALVFKGAADGVCHGIVNVGAAVDDVEVLAARFADDSWIASVFSFGDARGDFAVEGSENGSAAGEVQGRKVAMGEHSVSDGLGVTWDELDDVGWEAGFEENAIYEPV